MIQLDLNSPEFQANLLALPQQKPWAVLKTRSLPATQCRRIDCAALGQQVAGVLDPDKLLDVASGLAALKVDPITSTAVALNKSLRHWSNNAILGNLARA